MGIKMKRSFLFRKDSTIIDTFTSRIIVFMDRVCNRCTPDLSMAHRCREMEAIRRRNTWTVNDDEPSPPFLSTIFSNDLARLYSKQWNYSQIIRKAGGLVIFILLFFFYDYFQFVDSFWLNVSVKCGAVSFDVNSFFFFFFFLYVSSWEEIVVTLFLRGKKKRRKASTKASLIVDVYLFIGFLRKRRFVFSLPIYLIFFVVVVQDLSMA